MEIFSNKTPKCSAVIVAAGNSTRMGTDKLFLDLCGEKVIVKSIRAFQESELVNEIILVTAQDKIQTLAELVKECGFCKVRKVIRGGSTRMESSLAGISECSSNAKLIAIHDAARPLVTGKMIKELVYAAAESGAAIPAIPETDTVKVRNGNLTDGTLNREELVRVQTPQVFKAVLIKAALSDALKKKRVVSDESSAVDYTGVKSTIVLGDEDNIKLTTPKDVLIAEALIRARGEN